MTVSRTLRAVLFVVSMIAAGCGGSASGGSATSEIEPGGDVVDDPARIVAGINLSVHDVELTEVVFDTFDGGSVPLSEASEGQILDLLDAIPPIDDPRYSSSSDADWLKPDDLILGYVGADGSAFAYPHRVLNFHEIVNDDVAGTPILVSYCPLCRSGVVFDRRPDDLRHDGVLTFGNSSALYENDLVLVDRETSTYWWQLAGRGIVGDLSGAELRPLPSTTTTWQSWVDQHPDTQVLANDQGFGRDYSRDPFGGYADGIDEGRTPFPTSADAFADTRLSPSTRIVGFDVAGEPTTVPVLVNEPTVVAIEADPPLVVLLDGLGGGSVFESVIDGSSVIFEVVDGAIIDSTTESEWSVSGFAVEGSLKGAQLAMYPSRSSFWFAWVDINHPTTVTLVR